MGETGYISLASFKGTGGDENDAVGALGAVCSTDKGDTSDFEVTFPPDNGDCCSIANV